MAKNKGYKEAILVDKDKIDAKLTELIEGDNETERISARMMKSLTPLLTEIVNGDDPRKISGFVRGMASISISVLISLPPFMRERVYTALLQDLERSYDVVKKDTAKKLRLHIQKEKVK